MHFWIVRCLALSLLLLGGAALAQQERTLPPVTVSGAASPEPVEKSYRRMIAAMDLYERLRPSLAPDSTLRFKLLPRRRDVDLRNVDLNILSRSVTLPVPIADDQTFTLPRNARALQENAQVIPDREALTMTWRAQVRTPGLPANTRRLGDLRLECRVGMEAGLISNSPSLITRIFSALDNTPAYCDTTDNRYLFFADRPLWDVVLVSGARRERLPAHRLWAGAIDDPRMEENRRWCDCEVLLERSHFLPLEDRSWPDDTMVVYEYMDEPGR